jgi:4-hydroxymandelate oxidase
MVNSIMRDDVLTRRQAAAGVRAVMTGPATPPRPAPRQELVNVLEYEEQAKTILAAGVYALIAGGDRAAFDRITLRPRMLQPVLDLNLGVTLFGDALFAPVVVGPIAHQRQFHADGELATVAGASAAKAAMVISSRSSVPAGELLAKARSPVWYQVFANDPKAKTLARDAATAGCRAICVTDPTADWASVEAISRDSGVPVLVKGIRTPAAARMALTRGVQGVIVSHYRGVAGSDDGAAVLALPAIVDAVGGQVPVLADGSFRRGTDILKALAFGARAVLVGRPVMWGLAAYGADGVQGVIEMLQTELARYMAMCGQSNLPMLDRSIVRVHAAVPGKS